MELKVLGCDGGRGINYRTTSLLFNKTVLIDAGTIQSRIEIEEALKITDIFLTHTHFDHIVDLPFFFDATFGKRTKPVNVYGTQEALDALMKNIFNNKIWPDFSQLPTAAEGQFVLKVVKPKEKFEVNGLSVMPFSVNHTVETVGYKIADEQGSLIFSGDTAPTDELWAVANNTENLKAIIVDLAFPNGEQHIADLSKHMTSNDIEKELDKLKQDCDVYGFSYKVGMGETIDAEIKKVQHFGKPVKSLRDYDDLRF